MRKHILALALLLAGPALYAQKPVFEVASIAPCAPGTAQNPGMHNGSAQFVEAGGRFNARAVNVRYLIEWAYNIQPLQHSAGPAWIGTECFDIVAKAVGNASEEEMKLMARALLAERFQLRIHLESKVLPAFVASQRKSAPKLFTPKDGETHAMTFERQMGADQKVVSYTVVVTRYTLPQLNDALARQLERVIVDKTGLQGEFDFTLHITPDESRPNPMDATIILTAMREDLGLAVDARNEAMDFFVIDGAELPSAN